jgi:beta-fructofuranosidase
MISGGQPVSSGIPNPAVLYTGSSYREPLKKLGNFMAGEMAGVDEFEDISCPDFFKLGDKWVLVCISHVRGARYYIGRWNGRQFIPESHHRMNWPGGSFFAPETLLDDKGRRILWAWVLDRKSGVSSGTMSMPRVLSLAKDKRSLIIEPPKEIEALRYQPAGEKPFTIGAGQAVTLEHISGNSLELDMVIDPLNAKRFGFRVFCSADGREQTPVVIDLGRKVLQVDMRKSGLEPVEYKEFVMIREPNANIDIQEAPFELRKGERLHVRAFIDKSILEVFVNGRQCITQVVYPTLKDAVHIQLFTEDRPIKALSVKSWKLFPAMQW